MLNGVYLYVLCEIRVRIIRFEVMYTHSSGSGCVFFPQDFHLSRRRGKCCGKHSFERMDSIRINKVAILFKLLLLSLYTADVYVLYVCAIIRCLLGTTKTPLRLSLILEQTRLLS